MFRFVGKKNWLRPLFFWIVALDLHLLLFGHGVAFWAPPGGTHEPKQLVIEVVTSLDLPPKPLNPTADSTLASPSDKLRSKPQAKEPPAISDHLYPPLAENIPPPPVALVMVPQIEARELTPDEAPSHGLSVTGNPNSFNPLDYLESTQVEKRVRAYQNLEPVYPPEAFASGKSGIVIAELYVNEEGGVDFIDLISATEGFADSAMTALKTISFSPAMQGGKIVRSRLIVEVEYSLTPAAPPKAERKIGNSGL